MEEGEGDALQLLAISPLCNWLQPSLAGTIQSDLASTMELDPAQQLVLQLKLKEGQIKLC